MVFGTKELNRLYSVFIDYGSYLKLYVVPVIYLFALYLFWRLSRITQDLFLVSLGIGFLSILVFLPPATGWFFWVIPFLTYYQITSKKDFILISFIYNLVYVINTMLYENFLNLQSSPIYIYLFSSDNSRILSIFFTLQQSLGLLIAVRMYIYGLKRNNFYSTKNNTILISLEGNQLENISFFLNALKKLIYKKDINLSFINSIIDPFPLMQKSKRFRAGIK